MLSRQNFSFKSAAFVVKLPQGNNISKKIRVIVSTKVSKKATERNKIKRQLREIWHSLKINQFPSPHVYVKKAALSMSFSQLKDEFKKTIQPYL